MTEGYLTFFNTLSDRAQCVPEFVGCDTQGIHDAVFD